MHIALDRGNDDLALGFHVLASGFLLSFFFLDIGDEVGHGLFHDTGAFHHLRQKHLALAEQIAHHIHAVHQRPFNHVQGASAFGQDLLVSGFGVFVDELGDAMHQRVAEFVRHAHRRIGCAAPSEFGAVVLGRALGTFGHFDQTLTRCQVRFTVFVVGRSVEHHVFHTLAQRGFQVVVDAHHARVDDAHVHARLDGVVEKHGVDGFAHRVVATETERHVGHTATHLRAGQVLFDPAGGVDEVHRVVVVLFNAGGDGENIRVENDVFGRKTYPTLVNIRHQHPVSAFANFHLALVGVGLAFFVERHHHRGRAIALDQLGLAFEFVQALFHADGVDDALALDATQTRFDDAPLAAVDHDGHTGDVGFRGDQVQKPHHGRQAVEHGLVHVDVDDLRAVFHLLTRNGQGLLVLAVQDHAGKGLGASDVGALADVDEGGLNWRAVIVGTGRGAYEHGLQARELHGGDGSVWGIHGLT